MEESVNRKKYIRQSFFVARELQISIALLVVLALLGGVFLQSLSSALSAYFGIKSHVLGVFLVLGYAILVMALAIIFSHRLIGPFKRLEYEMRHIKAGEISRRLTVRTKDDLHVRNFVQHVNSLIESFDDMSKSYNKLNASVSTGLSKALEDLGTEHPDSKKLKEEIKSLQVQIHKYREKW
ncbi:MAG: hypothetical protein WA162_00930 [Thermodesulfobacteriota bacterium]